MRKLPGKRTVASPGNAGVVCLVCLACLLLVSLPRQTCAASPGDDGSSLRPATPSTEWYFAEGCVRPGFETFICAHNPGPSPAEVRLELCDGGVGMPACQAGVLPPGCSTAFCLNSCLPGGAADASGDVAARVSSVNGVPITAERRMSFHGNGYEGGHAVVGATSPSTRWYFAEGYISEDFDTYLCLANFGSEEARGMLTVYPEMEPPPKDDAQVHGAPTPPIGVPVALSPHTRYTLSLDTFLKAPQAFSVALTTDVPVVAERSMYFTYRGRGNHSWQGGHCVFGATEASGEYDTTYYFAEGTTRPGFEEWLTLQNPAPQAAEVRAEFVLGEGQGKPVTATYVLPPNSRRTVFVGDVVGPGKDVSVRLHSYQEFLAERPMYFSYRHGELAVDGGSCAVGAPQPGTEHYFPDGYASGPSSQGWLCLQNPGDEPARVSVTYISAGEDASSAFLRPYTLPPRSRLTLDVRREFGVDAEVSCLVQSDAPIVAEEAVYVDYPALLPVLRAVPGR